MHKCYFLYDRYFSQKVNALSNMADKTADISWRRHWFPRLMPSALVMTRYYPDLGSASDLLKIV